jgi:oligopeptide/dipeptide ABC transporter ATP-binding protein
MDNGIQWLTRVGIPDAADRMYSYPHELSGGMRQRVMIAMVLMMEPALIIADEPTTALDVTIQAQILQLLIEAKSRDTAVILITHNLGVVWETCSRMLVMYASEIVESGPVEKVFAQPGHPYTEALLKANPGLAARGDRLDTIPGQVPSPFHKITGCRFQDRCPFVEPRCRMSHPALDRISEREIRCVLSGQRTQTEGKAS